MASFLKLLSEEKRDELVTTGESSKERFLLFVELNGRPTEIFGTQPVTA